MAPFRLLVFATALCFTAGACGGAQTTTPQVCTDLSAANRARPPGVEPMDVPGYRELLMACVEARAVTPAPNERRRWNQGMRAGAALGSAGAAAALTGWVVTDPGGALGALFGSNDDFDDDDDDHEPTGRDLSSEFLIITGSTMATGLVIWGISAAVR